MHWKHINGRDYLYRAYSGGRNQSLGPRNAETEATKRQFESGRAEHKTRSASLGERVKIHASYIKANRLNRFPRIGARVVRAPVDVSGRFDLDVALEDGGPIAISSTLALEDGSRIALEGTSSVEGRVDLNADVAIKLVRPERATEARAVNAIVHEARLTARVEHPNVVRMIEHGSDDTDLYIVMEFVKGGATLRPFCDPEKRLPMPRVVDIVQPAP